MKEVNDSIREITDYLRLIDVDKKLSISESRKLDNVFYKRTYDIMIALESLELLKTMPKNKSRLNLMEEIELFLNPMGNKASVSDLQKEIETERRKYDMLNEKFYKLQETYDVLRSNMRK